MDCKEIQPVHSEGDQPWDFFGKNDAKAETPVLWPPRAKSWLIGKDSDAGRDWGLEKKGTTEDEMAGWHHGLDGRESEWTPGVGDGQGGLACCDTWVRKESDTTERLNWTRRRRWHLTPVLLAGKSNGQRSLVGCSPWGGKELDTTNWLIHFLWIWRYVSIHVIPKFYAFENMNRFRQFPSELIHNIVPFPQKLWAPTPILKNQNPAF